LGYGYGGALPAGGGAGGASAGTAGAFGTAGAGAPGAGAPAGGVPAAGGAPVTGGAGSGFGGAAQAGAGGTGGAVPTDGHGLYDLNCKLCHGELGGGSVLAPEIAHPVREYSTWVVRNGRAVTTFMKPMEKFGTDKLSDQQLNLIWDYLDTPPQPTTGQALFLDYCANCHGKDATGGPVMRNIINETQNINKLVRNGKSIGQYQMRHDSMPSFSTMRISDAELQMIYDYVVSL
jgi:mono/diheme cytochrome c family protein